MNVLAKIIGIVLAIILTATLMVPVIDDAIKTNQDEYQYTGTSTSFMSEGDTLTVEYDTTTSPVLNGAVYPGSERVFSPPRI